MTGERVTGSILGVVLAGGESRRFGREKALFPLLDRPMASWVLDALKPWTSDQVVIANDGEIGEVLEVRSRPDLIPGVGPMGGLLSALTWARDEGHGRLLLVACDLPLLKGDLLGRLIRKWPMDSLAVVPGSHGPLGFEPLCAGYDLRGLPDVQELVGRGLRSMESALDKLKGFRVPPEELGTLEELALAFTNVNTLESARRAEDIMRKVLSLTPEGRDLTPERRDPQSAQGDLKSAKREGEGGA